MDGLSSLAMLEGQWTLSRRIAHDDGHEDVFEGKALFVRSGPRLLQDEDGWLTPAGATTPLRATRRYIWAQNGDQIEVMFDDMRPFHCFSTNAASPTATHICPPDRYEVVYDFQNFPTWRSVWRVEGPRKAYEMQNLFIRD